MTCSVNLCYRPTYVRGYCRAHYKRWLRRSDVMAEQPIQVADHRKRFMRYTHKVGGCWYWTGYIDPGGYGRFTMGGRRWLAHRASYELFVGPIPDGLQLDHLCRVSSCVNPSHLEAVTPQENSLRGRTIAAQRAAQTHCVNCHAFDEANTYRDKRGNRQCRACHRISQRKYKEQRKHG